jgi:hypothetical protein
VTAHLSPSECIDALDGALTAVRRAHLEECPQCRAELSTLADTARSVEPTDVPDPSPLFWDHQAARIAAAIAAEPAPKGAWLPRMAWGGVGAAAVIAGLIVLMPQRQRSSVAPPHAVPGASTTTESLEADRDRAWSLLTTVGAELDEESAVDALQPSAATMDDAVSDLNSDERAALVALLRDGLKRRS